MSERLKFRQELWLFRQLPVGIRDKGFCRNFLDPIGSYWAVSPWVQIFRFITYEKNDEEYFHLNRYHRVHQCESESGTINQINEYEISSSQHSLARIAGDKKIIDLSYLSISSC